MPFRAIWLSMGASLLLKSEQMMASHEDVRQGGHHEQSVAVLLESPIAHLGKAEDALYDQEGVLDLGSHLGLGPVLLPLSVGERIVPATLLVGEVLSLRSGLSNQCLLAGVGRVAIDPVLIAMQKLRDGMLVMNVGRRGDADFAERDRSFRVSVTDGGMLHE